MSHKITDTPAPLSPLKQGVAAMAASTVNVCALMPLDTLTRKMQADGSSSYAGTLSQIIRDPARETLHPSRLYRGLTLAVTEAGMGRAMLFAGVAGVKKYLPEAWGETRKEVAGAFLFAVLRGSLTAPIDKVKTMRQVTAAHGEAGTWATVRHIAAQDSLAGFWRGISTDMLRNSIRLPLFMGLRSELTTQAKDHGWDERYGKHLTHIAVGAVAGVASEWASYPFFTAKVWMQKAESRGELPQGPFLNAKVMHTVASQHGLRGLYAGAVGRSAGYFVGAALFNLVFEQCKEMMG